MYISDAPINGPNEDKFNRGEFVARLAQTIREWNSPESFVIGIYGAWGSGKSSVLNLLEEELKQQQNGTSSLPTIQTVRFDPWFFNSAEQLLQTFFNAIEKAVQPLLTSKEKTLATVLKKYSNKLSFLSIAPEISIGPVKITIPVNREKGDDETPEIIRKQIGKILKDLNGRVVVMIDNIDRLDPTELTLIFKLVRLCSDFPHFIYLLAFDQKQVIKVLDNQLHIDADFLEKIIQVDINIPEIDQSQIDAFVGNTISQIANIHRVSLEDDFVDRFAPVYQTYIKKLIIDLRTAKRYLNAVAFSVPLVCNEVNYADFLALEVIRVFYPNIFQEIPKYEIALTSLDIVVLGGDDRKRKERNSVFNSLREWIKSVVNGDEELSLVVEGILGHLFPIFDAYVKNPQNPSYFPNYFRENLERNQNIASTTHFKRYFRLRVPTSDIPTSVILDFINKLNTTEEDISIDQFTETFKIFKSSDQLLQLLQKLIVYLPGIAQIGRERISKSLCLMSDTLNWNRNRSWVPEARIASNLLIRALPSKDNADEIIARTIEIIETSKSLSFAALFASKVISGEYREFIPEDMEKTRILSTLKARIHSTLIDKNIDVYSEYPDSYQLIISAWRSPQIVNEPEIALQYVYDKLSKNQLAIGQLLSEYLWREAGTGKPSDLEFSKIIGTYNVERLYELILSQKGEISRDLTEEFAIQEFLRLYKEYKQNKETDSRQ